MANSLRKICYLTTVAVLCFGTTAFADSVVLTLTGSSGQVIDGAAISPYTLNVVASDGSSQTVQMVCDSAIDFVDQTESWNASVLNIGGLTSTELVDTRFGEYGYPTLAQYQQAAWLAQQLVIQTDPSQVAEIQEAIWYTLDSAYYDAIGDPAAAAAQESLAGTWLSAAQANYLGGNYSNVLLYTPDPIAGGLTSDGGPIVFTPQNGDQGVPQEFMQVTADEPATSALFAAGLLGLLSLVVLRRRREVGNV